MPREDLQVRIAQEGDTVMVALVGEAHFDFDAAERHIQNIMSYKPRRVEVDASGMSFMSSVGMCFLLNLRRAVKENAGTMKLKGIQPLVRKTLEHARVIHLFEISPEPGTTTT